MRRLTLQEERMQSTRASKIEVYTREIWQYTGQNSLLKRLALVIGLKSWQTKISEKVTDSFLKKNKNKKQKTKKILNPRQSAILVRQESVLSEYFTVGNIPRQHWKPSTKTAQMKTPQFLLYFSFYLVDSSMYQWTFSWQNNLPSSPLKKCPFSLLCPLQISHLGACNNNNTIILCHECINILR